MNIALILSGGTGTRVGSDIPKQYISVAGKMIITYCMDTFFSSGAIDKVCIVADEVWHSDIREQISELEKKYGTDKFACFALPGATRQLSVVNGIKLLCQFAQEDDVVIIHDGARPMLSHSMIEKCLRDMEGHDGVMPVLPMKDTVYMSENGRTVSGLLKRESLFAGQSPEAFLFGRYARACEALMPDKILSINGSTEPAVMYGMDIAMTDGEESNYKITTPSDLERFKAYIEQNNR